MKFYSFFFSGQGLFLTSKAGKIWLTVRTKTGKKRTKTGKKAGTTETNNRTKTGTKVGTRKGTKIETKTG